MKKVLLLLTTFVLCFSLVACADNTSVKDESEPLEVVSAPEEKENKEVSFENNVYTSPDCTIKILETEILPAAPEKYQEKPLIVFTFEFTNNSNEEKMASTEWTLSMSLSYETDNTIHNLNIGFVPYEHEKYNIYNETSLDQVKPQGTVTSIYAYELDDTTTPLTLTASYLFKKIGTKEIVLQ